MSEDARYLKILDKWIGDLALENVHMGTMQPFIDGEKARGVKSRTINYPLQLVRHILNLASSEWIDETGKTWLENAPKIKLLPVILSCFQDEINYPVESSDAGYFFRGLF